MLAITFVEGIEIGVAVGTAVLALATWRMATATREMAQKAGQQADAAERLSAIAEQQLGIDAKRLEADTEPRLQVARRGDNSPVVQASPASGRLTVVLHNPTDARCEFAGCTIVLAGAGTFNGTLSSGTRIIGPDERPSTNFDLGKKGMGAALGGTPVVYTAQFKRPGAKATKKVIATLKAKSQGERWMLEDERSHGRAVF